MTEDKLGQKPNKSQVKDKEKQLVQCSEKLRVRRSCPSQVYIPHVDIQLSFRFV